jgi:serine/threonine-protein kinase
LNSNVARMDLVCDRMAERAERIEHLKNRMLALEARGRDFRSTIGRAVDALAGELSQAARERDEISRERDELERAREQHAARARGGSRKAQGEADALLWQIAASDEVLRAAVANCEDIEYQLQELSNQLQRLSESLEIDQNDLVREITEALASMARDDSEMRALALSVPG